MPPTLDRTDIDILALLQQDARLPMREIAAAVGLAPSSAHSRVRQLRAAGVLRGTHADVDPRAFGIGLEALFLIALEKREQDAANRLLEEIALVPEVRSTFLITGRFDLVVHVVVRDTRHLKELALDRFASSPRVARVESSIVFDARRRHELPMLRPNGRGRHHGSRP